MATTPTTKKKVAYLVKCDEACEIIYATSSAAARRLGANEIGIDFEDVESCNRAAYLDQYIGTDGPAPKLLIEEYNWRFECGNCFDSVDQDTEERVYDEYEWPYCCPKCLATDKQKTAASKAAKSVLRSAAETRWPGATICWLNEQNGTVFIRIDGAKAGALWHQATDALHGQPNDEFAWVAFRFSCPDPATPTIQEGAQS
jgi:hypothetical protein